MGDGVPDAASPGQTAEGRRAPPALPATLHTTPPRPPSAFLPPGRTAGSRSASAPHRSRVPPRSAPRGRSAPPAPPRPFPRRCAALPEPPQVPLRPAGRQRGAHATAAVGGTFRAAVPPGPAVNAHSSGAARAPPAPGPKAPLGSEPFPGAAAPAARRRRAVPPRPFPARRPTRARPARRPPQSRRCAPLSPPRPSARSAPLRPFLLFPARRSAPPPARPGPSAAYAPGPASCGRPDGAPTPERRGPGRCGRYLEVPVLVEAGEPVGHFAARPRASPPRSSSSSRRLLPSAPRPRARRPAHARRTPQPGRPAPRVRAAGSGEAATRGARGGRQASRPPGASQWNRADLSSDGGASQ